MVYNSSALWWTCNHAEWPLCSAELVHMHVRMHEHDVACDNMWSLSQCCVHQEQLTQAQSSADASSSAQQEVQELQGKLKSLTEERAKQQGEQDASSAKVGLLAI